MGGVEIDDSLTKWEWASNTKIFFYGSNDTAKHCQTIWTNVYIFETSKNVSIG